MKKYVGVKLIEATPMTNADFHKMKTGKAWEGKTADGYKVRYVDGYESWSPKETFDKAHIQVGDNNTIEERNIEEFIKEYDVSKWGDKTTVVHATLANGFILSESSSCVDPANFNMDIGENICKDRIANRLWGMLGFLLQTAVKGVK